MVEERDQLTALVHLYRGELGRMAAYRVRLDTTTNWAVGTTAALGSLSLGATATPQFVLLPLVLLILFMVMESRRYRSYRISHERVRLLETKFYAPILERQEDSDWRAELAEGLRNPGTPLRMWQAIGIRLRRNYLGLILVVVAAWLFKSSGAGGILRGAQVGPLPGGVVLAIIALATALMTVLALIAPRITSDE